MIANELKQHRSRKNLNEGQKQKKQFTAKAEENEQTDRLQRQNKHEK